MRAQEVADLFKELEWEHPFRYTIYLNEERLYELYLQRVGAVSEFQEVDQKLRELSAAPWSFGVKASSGGSLMAKTQMNPRVMIAVVERVMDERGMVADLGAGDFQRSGMLLRGRGRLALSEGWWSDAFGDLPTEVRSAIRLQQERQQSILALSDEDAAHQMVTWVGRAGSRVFAAIGSSKLIVWSQAEYHAATAPVRLLGTFAREIDNVAFLQPLWLATEPYDPELDSRE